MRKEDLIKKLKEKSPGGVQHTKDQIINWILQLDLTDAPVEVKSEKNVPNPPKQLRKPMKHKVGDVLMHGAFKHPYVLLEKKEGYWICGLLSTEPTCNEILEPCRSRFFPDSFITRTLFTSAQVLGTFMNTYDNTPHLKKVNAKLKAIFE